MDKAFVITGFKDDLAVLSEQNNGQNIGAEYYCSKKFLPINSKVGDIFRFSISSGADNNDPNKLLAKNILNEILNIIENTSV